MGVVYNFDSLARVLTEAKPITYNGSWEVIKGGLLEAGEISEEAGVVQKVISINRAASTTETAGETLSALCAMDVSESTVAGATVTTLTPKAAITFTPKTVALCSIAGAVGLDFGFRIGQNLANLYFGDDWDWHAPGIFDVAKDAIRTYVKADGTTYYDKETINAFSNRLNDVGAFNDGSYVVDEVVLGGSYSFSGINTNNIPAHALNHLPNLIAKLKYNIDDNDITELIYNEYDDKWTLTLKYFPLSNIKYPLYLENRLQVDNIGYSKDEKYLKLFYDGIKNGYFSDNTIKGISLHAPKELYTGWYSSIVECFNDGRVVYSLYDNRYDHHFVMFFSNSPKNIYTYNIGKQSPAGISGVTKQPNATVPTKFPLEIPETYPTWTPTPLNKPDGVIQTYPVEMPDINPSSEKTTKPQDEAQKGKNKNPEKNPVIENSIIKLPEIVPNIKPQPAPTIDGGDTPTPVIPPIGVEATGFVALYNPTQSQLSSFSQYLWSDNFIDNFKKLFANPMDAIIGLHMIYATPSRGSEAEIVCGYAHSGVMSNTVNSQYIEINCGSIKVNRYFGNVLDYAPYTKLQVYLPFVGIVDLDTNEIMSGTLNIKYRIDVLTGSCLARLKVTRGDYNAELYNFAGNCAVQLPISGGSYSGIIANAIGVAGSVGATIASGGALAPVLVGSAVSSAINSHVNVSHSGSLGSNAGALGIMKPYLIITRPKPAEADNFNEFYGKPSNKTVRLSSCSGYTRVKDVHVDNIVATDNELSEIEQLLKEGVII